MNKDRFLVSQNDYISTGHRNLIIKDLHEGVSYLSISTSNINVQIMIHMHN